MIVIWFGVIAFALVCLGCCWYLGEVSLRTRIVFTVLYLASWGLLLLRDFYFLFYLAQIVLIMVIGVATFGLDWLIGRN